MAACISAAANVSGGKNNTKTVNKTVFNIVKKLNTPFGESTENKLVNGENQPPDNGEDTDCCAEWTGLEMTGIGGAQMAFTYPVVDVEGLGVWAECVTMNVLEAVFEASEPFRGVTVTICEAWPDRWSDVECSDIIGFDAIIVGLSKDCAVTGVSNEESLDSETTVV